jgi:hypothetical protein
MGSALNRAQIEGILTLAAALAVTVICATGSAAALSAEELSDKTVAIVSHVPVELGTITKIELRRALVQRAAQQGYRSTPKPGGKRHAALEKAALGEQLDIVWISGQAAEMGISVTPRQVSRELAAIKRQNFKNEAEYRRFLRRMHYTQQDVNTRVELQMLSAMIQERVAGGKSNAGRLKALERFVAAYAKRWRARTVCAEEYATDRCSNGPPAG